MKKTLTLFFCFCYSITFSQDLSVSPDSVVINPVIKAKTMPQGNTNNKLVTWDGIDKIFKTISFSDLPTQTGNGIEFNSLLKAKYDSAYTAFKNAFSGDTSVIFAAYILKPNAPALGTSGYITWDVLGEFDQHDTLYSCISVVPNPSDGTLRINWPAASKVVNFTITPDETLSLAGITAGASVAVNFATINVYIPNQQYSIIKGNQSGQPTVIKGWQSETISFNISDTSYTVTKVPSVYGYETLDRVIFIPPAGKYALKDPNIVPFDYVNYSMKFFVRNPSGSKYIMSDSDMLTIIPPPSKRTLPCYYTNGLNECGAIFSNAYGSPNFWVFAILKK